VSEFFATLPPGMPLILGAFLFPVLPKRLQQVWLPLLPIVSFLHLWYGFPETHGLLEGTKYETTYIYTMQLFNYTITPIRIDSLAMVWGVVFHIAAVLGGIYSMHVDDDSLQHVAGMSYAGAAIGAVFAGDLATLFVFWELTAITSVFLIWANRTDTAYTVGLRYLIIQVMSGVILLAGLLLRLSEGGGLDFAMVNDGASWELGETWTWLILLSFGIKAAFPFLHNWLQDAYPAGTVTGTVFLSAFTTKLAIYALCRGFAGNGEVLIPIGAVMTAFPIFFAVMENDLRKVLSYSLNNQLGFMIVGIGIGTPLAINGAAGHAFAHIIYKGLLFMGVGAVLHRTGTAKCTELGGLARSMPYTTFFTIVGAMSISAFPLFSGFVTKSMVLSAAAHEQMAIVYLVLVFASAGVMDHSGIKVPYFAFFAHDSGKRPQRAPLNMLVAMGLAAALCIGIGIYYQPLYAMLPLEVHHAYVPYSAPHVVTQYQLLLFSALAFVFLQKTGLYPDEVRAQILDFDWTYRRAIPSVVRKVYGGLSAVRDISELRARHRLADLNEFMRRYNGPGGIMSQTWPTGRTAWWAALILGVFVLTEIIRIHG